MILQKREDELDKSKIDRGSGNPVDNEKLQYLEAKIGELEKEKKALGSTLESKQNKIDQLLKAAGSNTTPELAERREECVTSFEKDITSLCNSMINEIRRPDRNYTSQHIQQDIQSLQKLITVSFAAIRKNPEFAQSSSKLGDVNVSSSVQSMQQYKQWADYKSSELMKSKSPAGKSTG